MTDDPSLRDLLDRAYATHADAPGDFAALLAQRAPELPPDALGGESIRLAEHLWLGHLADPAGLQSFIAALPAALHSDEATAPSLRRAAWAMAALQAAPDAPTAPSPPDASRWRALQNVLLAMVRQGRSAQAQAMLLADEAAAATHADIAARQAYAACANNIALDLRLGVRDDATRDALMLAAAALARRAWGHAGTWLHAERAEYQLALCHAVLGHAEPALHHAGLCLAAVQANSGGTLERFFAHEALARAHQVAGQPDAARGQAAQMRALLDQIADQADHAWCAKTLDALPA